MIEDIGTVYAAEISRRLKSKPFLIGLAVGVIFILVFTKLPRLFEGAFEGSNAIVLVGSAPLTHAAEPLLAKNYKIQATLPPQPVDQALLKAHRASAAFLLSSTPSGLRVLVRANDPSSMEESRIKRDLLPLQLQLATHRSSADVARMSAIPLEVQTVASKFTSSDQASAARVIAYTMIFFLYMLILLNSQLVMSAVAEEKTSRIAELLVASVDPTALLGGKILAAVTLAVLQMVVWVGAMIAFGGNPAASSTAAASAAQTNPFGLAGIFDIVTPGVAIAFLAFFVIGLFQLSTMFAAVASLVNRTEDIGSISTPFIFGVVAALFIAIGALGTPDAPWAVACSFVPLISAFVMFARIAVGTVPLWQIALSLGINLLALWAIAVLAGKIYRVGMLLYGRTPKFAQIWSVIRS